MPADAALWDAASANLGTRIPEIPAHPERLKDPLLQPPPACKHHCRIARSSSSSSATTSGREPYRFSVSCGSAARS